MRFLQALAGQKVDRTPVWIMRQAGRYMEKYRKLREQATSFLDFCANPQLTTQATLLPLDRYPLDAGIIFSDILVIPAAMGLPLEFVKGQGPVFNETIKSLSDIKKLKQLTPQEDLGYVLESISMTKAKIGDMPLIGFAGSPWTLAVYMLEGHGKTTFPVAQKALYQDPELVQSLLITLENEVAKHLIAQAEAGVDALMVFDSWGGILSPHLYEQYSLASIKSVIDKVRAVFPKIPIISFSKGCFHSLAAQTNIGADCLGIDQFTRLDAAKEVVGSKVALQGNLNPSCLYMSKSKLQDEVKKVLDVYAGEPGHIFNLGHGILPDVPEDALDTVCDTIQNYG